MVPTFDVSIFFENLRSGGCDNFRLCVSVEVII